MVERIRKAGWLAIEATGLLIILCLFLSIILGAGGGAFITEVARNATAFLQAVPPGTLLGVALILGFYWWFRRGRT
jgi:Na+/H+-dicarboxylate symporter